MGFSGGSAVKNSLPANTDDAGLIPESGRSPGGGNAKRCTLPCFHVFATNYEWPSVLLCEFKVIGQTYINL